MKKIYIAYLITFIVLFMTPQLVFFVVKDKISTRNYEQRTLAEMPKLSIDSITKFPGDFDSYYSDHAPFRTQMIEQSSLINYHIFGTGISDNVIIGKDGWLFFNRKNPTEDPMFDYYHDSHFTKEELAEIANKLTSMKEKYESMGKEFIFFMIQNKESVYCSEFLPDYYPRNNGRTRGDQLIDYLRENTDINIVYTKDAIKEAKMAYPEYSFYFKTDTHWNYLGGYVGARELLSASGISLPSLDKITIDEYKSDQSEPCDLANMAGLAKFIDLGMTYRLYGWGEREYSRDDTGSVGTDYIIHTACKGVADKRLCVLGDSFITHTIPYLCSSFSEVALLNNNIADETSVDAEDADIIVFETAERGLRKVFL